MFNLKQKGQLNAETLLAVPIMLLMFYISLEILSVVNTSVLFPLLDSGNVANGATIKLLVQLIPLILIMLVIVGVWMSAKYRSQQVEY